MAGFTHESATARLARLLTMVPWLVNRQGIDLREAADDLGVSVEQLEADLNLLDRAAKKTLSPLILRPGGLTDEPATHAVQLGSPHLGRVSREDVAGVALRLLEKGEGAPGGLVVDLMGPSDEEKGESWEAAVDRVCKDRTVI